MSDLYIGRTVADSKPLLYTSRDLLTHGVCVGMTGSGKTGLCIGFLEELLLSDVPLFLLDPKGDVSNLLLVFPDLRPEDFAPWVDPDSARRAGRSVEEEAAIQAKLWREGLEKSGVDLDSLKRLREKVAYRVFTPGSRAARPVNLLGSFEPPRGAEQDEEALRDEIRGLVSGVLTLGGIDADPLSDARHNFLALIVESRWARGQALDLKDFVALAENPPFEQIGAMNLDAVLPRAKRRELAVALNNLLSRDFEAWRSGDPLDPARLLRGESGQTACNLFSLSHLDDRERMFFVTRFLERLWTWTRTQSGTSDLRALLYFDEVFGYLPPSAEPPSKRPLLSMLKQARGFGVGALLVTQNPVDLDYKALTNAGTWLVGRLQAERDKDRLLDGLESAGIGMPRSEVDRTISGLAKRRFLLHDVHREGGPVVFESRWARAFLRGPLAPRQLGDLARFVGDDRVSEARPSADAGRERATGRRPTAPGSTMPEAQPSPDAAPVPPAVDPVFQHRYAAGASPQTPLAGEVVALFEARVSRQRPLVSGVKRGVVRFGRGRAPIAALDSNARMEDWSVSPPAGASYRPLPEWALAPGATGLLERQAREVVSAEGLQLDAVPGLTVVRSPEESVEDYEGRLRDAVAAETDRRVAKLTAPLARRLATLERQLAAEARELERDRAERNRAAAYSAIDVGASVLGTLLGGRRGSVGSTGRAGGRAYGRIQRAAENIKESEEKIAAWTRERDSLTAEIESESLAARAAVEAAGGDRQRIRIPVNRTDVRVLGWFVLWEARP